MKTFKLKTGQTVRANLAAPIQESYGLLVDADGQYVTTQADDGATVYQMVAFTRDDITEST